MRTMIEKVICDVCDTVIEPPVVEDIGRAVNGERIATKISDKNYHTAVIRGMLMGSIECHVCKVCSKVLFRFFNKMKIDARAWFESGDI